MLAEHGISFDPNLVVPGDFARETGVGAIRMLLEERGLVPGVGLEAILAANDDMAFGALEALQARGIRVPNDVALVGFDDREESRCVLPPLTTVRNPLHQLGTRAAEMLIALIEGQDVPDCEVLPSDLVVRRSCGCMPRIVQSVAQLASPPPADDQSSLADRRGSVLPALTEAVDNLVGPSGVESVEALWDGFIEAIEGRPSEGAFFAVLEEMLYQTAAADLDPFVWQDILSVLHDQVLPYLNCDNAIFVVELLSRARGLVSDVVQRFHGYRVIREARQTQTLSDIEYALSATFDMKELLDAAAEFIPLSGISSYYIVMFEDPQVPTTWSELLLACEGQERIETRARRRRFPSWQLLPAGLLEDRRYSLVAELLYVRDHQLGIGVFEARVPQEAVCRVLRRQISGALWGVLLLRAREEAEAALGKAYTELKATQEELLHQERLATLGKVAATVSHEIRNPLATIRMSVATVERKTQGQELGVKPTLERIQRNITRCDSIIAELLDYTRAPELQFESVRFDDWLGQVLDEQTLPEGILLSQDLASGVEMSLDVERFRRLIINLVDNAWQAMAELPESSDRDRVLTVQSSADADRLKLVIADVGCGISPNVMAKIFDPLFSTKSFGIGLGLSVVREIVKQHNGEIEITSQEGAGTQVAVWLPLPHPEDPGS